MANVYAIATFTLEGRLQIVMTVPAVCGEICSGVITQSNIYLLPGSNNEKLLQVLSVTRHRCHGKVTKSGPSRYVTSPRTVCDVEPG